jgi:hypothetical protein
MPTRPLPAPRRRAAALAASLALVLAALALPAAAPAASDFVFFKTPSGNIGCAFIDFRGKSLRCDLREISNRPPARPASCDFDYGQSFGLKPKGRARRLCVSDSVMEPSARRLAYGHSIRRFGIRCTSRTRGLRCVNRRGHGFTLSRDAQTLF